MGRERLVRLQIMLVNYRIGGHEEFGRSDPDAQAGPRRSAKSCAAALRRKSLFKLANVGGQSDSYRVIKYPDSERRGRVVTHTAHKALRPDGGNCLLMMLCTLCGLPN